MTQSPTALSDRPTTSASAADDLALLADARKCLDAARDALLREQTDDGYWCAELEGDSILQSEYILLKWIVRQEDDPRIPAIANYLRRQQREDGAWVQYPGGKPDISATVKGYFALKLSGDDIDAPHMVKARSLIRELGGAERCNTFTKFYFACLGQVRYSACATIPPEIVYLPRWFYFHMDKVSAWTRTMITPLSIVTTHQPVRELPAELGIDELYLDEKARHALLPKDNAHPFWTPVFLTIDRLLKLYASLGVTPGRERALKWIESWMVEHTDRSEGLGAIFPPMVYIQIALRCRGYTGEETLLKEAERQLDDLMIHDETRNETRIQPCFSPIWDTGIALYALAEAGLDHEHEAVARCADWLVSKECREAGDWAANVTADVEPSGWFFEYENGFYPDVDDTAMVAMALRRVGGDAAISAAHRGVQWILAMQNDDGGWAAFDKTKDRPILEHVPFADHNAIQDPSCPDITGRTLEALGHHGYSPAHPAVQRAVEFIKHRQEPEGCWFGRWGVNYIYGSFQVLCGLQTVGVDMSENWIRKAGDWLKGVQQEDGSFGETANTYENPPTPKGEGPSTASQTAWGMAGLLAVFGPDDPDVARAARWLIDTQLESGTWEEPWFTGTGFPKVFYLRYHLYRLYFPVMVLGRWLREKA